MDGLNNLTNAIANYDAKGSVDAAKAAMAECVDPLDALDAITAVLSDIGQRFGDGELFLPELIGAAHATQAALPIIEDVMQATGKEARTLGTIVIGTVSGDIHDIGKSMVSALLIALGFRVIDLGTDVPTQKFLETIKAEKVDILALSALLTTTAAQQKDVIEQVDKLGIRDTIKIMVGGGAVNADFAASIGADGYGETAAEGVTIAKELLGIDS
jgi:corrinoid protein of di/trimethylamine methyltransferase